MNIPNAMGIRPTGIVLTTVLVTVAIDIDLAAVRRDRYANAVTDWDRADHRIGRSGDHRYRDCPRVRDIDLAAVRGDRDAGRAVADRDRADHGVGRGVD